MFIYEDNNTINLALNSSKPVTNPDLVIKGFQDGVKVTVDGKEYGKGSVEFTEKAPLIVYQKDGKLEITFKGVAGMSNPEVIVDKLTDSYSLVADGGESVKLTITDSAVTVLPEEEEENSTTEEPSQPVNTDSTTEGDEPEQDPENISDPV